MKIASIWSGLGDICLERVNSLFYNLPGIDWERGWSASTGEQMVIDTFNDMFWTQHVRGATHVGGNTLDLLTSSNRDMIVDLKNHGYLGTSDHIILEASIAGPIRGVDSDELIPDWSKADLSNFKESVANIDWQAKFLDKSGKECMAEIYQIIENGSKTFVPLRPRRISSKPVWMNRNILRLIRKVVEILFD